MVFKAGVILSLSLYLTANPLLVSLINFWQFDVAQLAPPRYICGQGEIAGRQESRRKSKPVRSRFLCDHSHLFCTALASDFVDFSLFCSKLRFECKLSMVFHGLMVSWSHSLKGFKRLRGKCIYMRIVSHFCLSCSCRSDRRHTASRQKWSQPNLRSLYYCLSCAVQTSCGESSRNMYRKLPLTMARTCISY